MGAWRSSRFLRDSHRGFLGEVIMQGRAERCLSLSRLLLQTSIDWMAYKQQKLFFMFLEAGSLSDSMVEFWWGSFSRLHTVSLCHLVLSSQGGSTEGEKKLSFEDTNPIHEEGPIPMISPNPCYPQSPTPNTIKSRGFNIWILEGHKHLVHNRCERLSQIKEAGERHSGSVCKGPNMHLMYIEKQRSSVWPKRGDL